MSKILLVIDGGRSHLRAHALTLEGEELAVVRESGISPVLRDWKGLVKRLESLPKKAASVGGFRSSEISVVAAGLAGFDREEDAEDLSNLLASGRKSLRWFIESDARQTLRAASPEGPVLVGLLGTGSAFFARTERGEIYRTGGWGALLDDAGSGFELSRQGIIAVVRAEDGTGPETSLRDPLLNAAGVGVPADFLRVLYTDAFQPAFWARFAPAVLHQAEKGDGVAGAVVENEVRKVVEHFVALVRKSRVDPGTRIYLTGGTVHGSRFYFERIREVLHVHLPQFPVDLLQREPFWGGWELARKMVEENSAQ